VRRVPDWGAAALGLGLMPMLFELSSYYYSGWLAFAPLWTLGGTPGIALSLLAWASNVISSLFPAADERYALLSLATVVFAVTVTAAFGLRRGGGNEGRR
jgi:hypothetical protein